MRKVGFLCIALIVALGSLGVGYAKWSNELDITGNLTTNVLSVTTGTATTPAGGTTATLNGTLTGTGVTSSVAVSFDYGLTDAYLLGNVTATESPLSGTGSFSKGLTGLTGSTTYHFRAKAVGGATTVYGLDQTFTTTASGPTIYFSQASFSSGDATGSVTPSGTSINTQTLAITFTASNNGNGKSATVDCTLTNNSGSPIKVKGALSYTSDGGTFTVTYPSGTLFNAIGTTISAGGSATGQIRFDWAQQKDHVVNGSVTYQVLP